MKLGRNDPCLCGSGKKFKKCCAAKPDARLAAQNAPTEGALPTLDECNHLIALFNAGHLVELEGQSRLLVERYPESGFAWKALGVSLQVQGKNALPALQKAKEFLPGDAEAHCNLGNALKDIGQLEAAVASYHRTLEIKPDYADAHYNLGNALKSLGQLDDAVASYRRALEIKPDYAEAHYNLGNARRYIGQLDDAVMNYRRALEIKPGYAEAHCNLGNTLKDLGQLDDALASYCRALEIKPDFAEAHCNLGNVLKDLGQLDAAVASYRRVLEIKPDYAEAHYNLGNARRDLGQLDDAVASYRRTLEIKPDFTEAHCNLGNVLKDLGQLDAAVASYHRALEIKPDYADAYNNLGNVLKDLVQLDAAVASYRRALEIKPDYADAYSNLGNVLKDLGQLDAAVASYRRVLEIKPDYAEVHYNLGALFMIQGKQDEALSCFRRQVRLTPENDVAQHHIASLTGINTERAPSQYVEKVFDSYADKFDTHLQQVLEYAIPEKLVAFITQHATPPTEKWNVLDLGCGTGLVGLAIAPFARQLVGVDLSAKMLEKAHARSLYRRLEHLDLLTMMRAEEASSYDVIIAADVFIYLGRLDEIISEIKRLLRPSGIAAFSVETLDALSNEKANQCAQRDYQLASTGRYTHSASYITKLGAANGFLVQEMTATQIRMEHCKPVNGHLVLWKH